MTPTRKRWLLVGLLSITHGVIFTGGYLLAWERSRAEIGERALSSFMDGLGALAYLEKGNLPGVRHTLRVTLDGDLITMFRYGTPGFDAYSAETGRDPKSKLLATYDEIRSAYPPIEYGDGGWMNQRVDEIVKSARPSGQKK
jgi:hypothetical protein